jgi:hypothetical protein
MSIIFMAVIVNKPGFGNQPSWLFSRRLTQLCFAGGPTPDSNGLISAACDAGGPVVQVGEVPQLARGLAVRWP